MEIVCIQYGKRFFSFFWNYMCPRDQHYNHLSSQISYYSIIQSSVLECIKLS
jgi:hypothetical protein